MDRRTPVLLLLTTPDGQSALQSGYLEIRKGENDDLVKGRTKPFARDMDPYGCVGARECDVELPPDHMSDLPSMKLYAIGRDELPLEHIGEEGDSQENSQKPYGPKQVQRSHMLNGIQVAAVHPLGSQMGACTVMFQAGSRVERDGELGATHFIRAMSGSSGRAYSGYGKMRTLHQRGCYLTCSSDRQSIAYTLRCPLDDFSEMKYYLLDTAARCCFHEWELEDIKPFIKDNLVRIHPKQRLLDLLQRALWGGPLGNSMFCEEDRIGHMTTDHLKGYMTNFGTKNCSIASFGLPFEETMKLAESLSMEFTYDKTCGREPMTSFPRGDCEYYDLGQGSDTWVAVGVPGAGTSDICSTLKHALVAMACGVDYAQVGQHTLDRIAQTPLCSMADDLYTEYRAFNISYSETGLFGVMARTRPSTAEKVARVVVAFLSNVDKLNADHIDVAKKRLKLNLALHEEDCVQVAEGMALQIANDVQIDGTQQYFSIIDSIPNEEILLTANEISSKQSYMAIAVVGDTSAVPPDVDLIKNLL
ncbi:cytochrome b-c1 complex subunit 2, mitochondrial-like [Battus philenor]|uniref:cytochrome b-c1 complex subunit 2, mitochondrial-like n=1 Tax=Battus philenor TaxID=42288 RepID=UPI0035CFBD4D